MNQFFQFEADFVESLRCIPMQVRYNLDRCGIKLKLHQWNRFSAEQRQQLIDLPCATGEEIQAYRGHLQQLILVTTGETASELDIDPHPDWENAEVIPASVTEKSEAAGASLTLPQWSTLSSLQRFALIKLSRSNHENKNFVPALEEFNLV